ncbi:MAG: metallophosphoesterase [Paludibaculum sp.]
MTSLRWLYLSALPIAVLPAFTAPPSTPWTDAEKADFLRQAPVVAVKILKEGVTSSHRATLRKNGRSHDAHIQTVDESGMLASSLNFERGFSDSYRHNLAAYELNRILGLERIPVTVAREYRRQPASYTWWVDDEVMTERVRQARNIRPPSGTIWNDQVYIMKVFDQLIYNVDRNTGNIVIDQGWKLWMIDHTRAFRVRIDLMSEEDLVRCDKALLERLRKLDPAEIRSRLSPWLSPQQIDTMMVRRDLIVRHFEALAVQKGESIVYYGSPRKGPMRRRDFLKLAAAVQMPAATRLVAVGDVHGDLDRFIDVLSMAGLVDDSGAWSGGGATLVQLGDLVDRGTKYREVIDFLTTLRKQAERAGGAVHCLVGNHEAMRMYGDFRYVAAAEYQSFATSKSENERDRLFERDLARIAGSSSLANRSDLSIGFRTKWEKEAPSGAGGTGPRLLPPKAITASGSWRSARPCG